MENKYPYIGKSEVTGGVVLLTSQGCGYFVECNNSNSVGRFSKKLHETYFTNITANYLRNTKIRIESPEHSEFVQKLVFGAGGKWIDYQDQNIRFLEMPCLFIDKELNISFFDKRAEYLFSTHDNKEIKLPMSPQEKQADEWLKVGDECVLVSIGMTTFNKLVRITYVGDGVGCYIDLSNNTEYTYAKRDIVFKKMPTQQEKLTNEICNQIGSKDDSYALAKAILAGEIEGLTYKP